MRSEPTQAPVLVDIDAIATMLDVSISTSRRLVREVGFPSPVRIRSCIRWRRQDVLDYVTGEAKPSDSADR